MKDLALNWHAQVDKLEAAMVREGPIPIPVTNRFIPGLYSREIRIPAGTLMTGRVHLGAHLSIMVSGKMQMAGPEGLFVLEGYNVFEAQPGTRRVGLALEDTIWITVHPNADDSQDLALIEQRLVEPANPALAGPTHQEQPCLS